MIKINLLPEVKRKVVKKRAKVAREIPFTWIIAGIVALLLTSALLAWIHVKMIEEQSDLQKQIAQVEQEINRLNKEQEHVERARVQRNALAQKLEIIATLKKRKTGPVHLLDQLAGSIPARVWLSEMNETGNAMTISGFAIDHTQIALFMDNLKKSPFFSNIELISAGSLEGQKKPQNQFASTLPTKQFEITCRVSYPTENR